ncbi:two-component sensor histidine kinase [Streptomyces mashuensis]|uniref:histidine kinase n=1 Tax=Streptomyces mashuensis TaxID=33904 RepID=A0A919B461_9ACTN|nr:histidine kinase [Streptomyces mashuensis]GHF45454.1 two-component sensor histidine kinase [Streptomyces mashuensis]
MTSPSPARVSLGPLLHRLRRANPWVVDAVVTGVVQIAVTVPFVVPRAADVPPATWWAYVMTTLTVVPLLWRSRAPLACLLAITAAGFAYVPMHGPGQPLPYSSVVAFFTVAATGGVWQRRVTLWAGVPLVGLSVAVKTNTAREYFFSFFLFSMVYVLGVLTRTRQAYTEAVEQRAAELEKARLVEVARAAERERARIAREMHDVLSHAVSLMMVQAEAGPLLVRSDPERAEAVFDAIAGAGRDAMVQLRRMLGVLREDGEAGASRAPQPTLAGLGDLVEEVRRAGLVVRLATEGEQRALAPDVEVAVYRVVQEALTNVLKHAGAGAVVDVRLGWSAERLTVGVEDDGGGSGGAGVGAGAGRRSRNGTAVVSGGRGLVGIRERAAAHGGSARFGPGPEGRGYRVAAEFPLVVCSAAEVGT